VRRRTCRTLTVAPSRQPEHQHGASDDNDERGEDLFGSAHLFASHGFRLVTGRTERLEIAPIPEPIRMAAVLAYVVDLEPELHGATIGAGIRRIDEHGQA
jgi:hypothetical protein